MNNAKAGIDWDRVQNILVVRDDRLGDMALYLVLIQNLARHLPGKRIAVFCSAANLALIEDDPSITSRFVIKNGGLTADAKLDVESHPPDVVIYYQSYPNFADLAASLKTINPTAIFCSMIEHDEEALAFTTAYNSHGTGSMYERVVRYAAWLLGRETSAIYRPQLHIDRQVLTEVRATLARRFPPEHPLVYLNLSGGAYKSISRYLRRNLSAANYVRIIREIKRHNARTNFVVTAAPQDASKGERVSEKAGNHVFFCRDTSIQELAALMELASVVITPETAVSHIASVLNKRLVTLFFAEKQLRDWRPFSQQHRCVTPRYLPLLWTIDAQQVADAALELLGSGETLSA